MSSITLQSLKNDEEQYLCKTYGRYPVAVKHGKDSRLWDFEGREYIDLLAGIAVTNLGHCNEEIAQTIAEQAKKLIHVSNLFYQEEQITLAKKLLSTAHFGKAFFCNSGAEANEAAIKLARRYHQRVKNTNAFEVITFSGCFHGRTLATVAATGQAKFQDGFAPMPQGFIQVPWGDMAALEQAVSPNTAAILMEMVQGEGGIRPMTQEYADKLAAFCKENGLLFIVDEVQAGLARTGKWWAFQHFGLQPDILTTAKGLANGLPMGAMMATNEVAQGFAAGSHATTFGGGALLSAVALKVLEIIERDKLAARAHEVGTWAMNRFRQVGKKLPGTIKEVRGMGLMIGIDLTFPGKEVWEALIQRGFILNLTQDTILRLLPALTIDKADIETFAVALEEVLAQHAPK